MEHVHQCTRCGEPYLDCVCPDEPEKDDVYWYYMNRAGENFLAWLRLWHIIK